MSSQTAKLAALFISCLVLACQNEHKSSPDNKAPSSDLSQATVEEPGSTEQFTDMAPPPPAGEVVSSSSSVTVTNGAVPVGNGNFYVVINGNNSCKAALIGVPGQAVAAPVLTKSAMYARFLEMIQLNPDLQGSSTLFLCYGDRTPNLFYTLFSPAGEASPMLPVDETMVKDLVLQHAGGARQVHIIGFSYGGGLAIEVAASVAAVANFPVSLYTIDPINRALCQRLVDPGCRGSYELPPAMNDILRPRVHWVNFYQAYPGLRSGTFFAADANIYVNVPHHAIDSRASVWATIATSLCQQLRGELVVYPTTLYR